MWPLFLIGLGVWLIIKEKEEGNDNFGSGNQYDSTNDKETTF